MREALFSGSIPSRVIAGLPGYIFHNIAPLSTRSSFLLLRGCFRFFVPHLSLSQWSDVPINPNVSDITVPNAPIDVPCPRLMRLAHVTYMKQLDICK